MSNVPPSSTSALFGQCYTQHKAAADAVMLCLTLGLESKQKVQDTNLKEWLFVLAGAMVFVMQLGFAMVCAGCVRRKNVSNTLLKNLLDACGAAVAFFAIGYAFAFGGIDPSKGFTFVGTANFFLTGTVDFGVWFLQYTFSASAVTIIAGTIAERCRMSAYICYSLFMTGFVYPVIAHSIWSDNGFLSRFAAAPFLGSGALDFSGSGVVHLTGGTTALVATWVLGARKGRFTDENGEPLNKPKAIPGHSIALQVMGTLMLWFGWYGFNSGSALLLPDAHSPGSVAALAASTTTLSGATGAFSALLTHMYFHRSSSGAPFDLSKALNGALGGLVAITAGCGVVEPWAAVLIGAIAGWTYLLSSSWLLKLRLDDAVDGIPVHMFCGIWGLLATGLLASPNRMLDAFANDDHVGFFYSLGEGTADATLLLNQFLEILFILGWSVGLMLPFFLWLNYVNWLRADALEEIAGLDASYKHATQEDHEELKKSIMKEYRKHKASHASQSSATRDTEDLSPPERV